MSSPTIHTRDVRYHADASGLFAHLGGSLLLESADITTKSGISSLAVLASSVRLTCTGHTVTAEALSESGEVIVEKLNGQLAGYGRDTFTFPRTGAVDERERLTAVSPVEPLRALTRDAGYSTDTLPMLAGGIGWACVTMLSGAG